MTFCTVVDIISPYCFNCIAFSLDIFRCAHKVIIQISPAGLPEHENLFFYSPMTESGSGYQSQLSP